MEIIFNEGSPKTPVIKADSERGYISIQGRSNPENSSEFYKPFMDWLDEYMTKPASLTIIDMNLEHFNTSSSKCILDVLKRIKKIIQNGKECKINWYYEDDDDEMLETAEIYEHMTGLNFVKIGIPEA